MSNHPTFINVDATTSFIVSGMKGCPVELVLYDEGHTRLIKTLIHTPMPLSLKVIDDLKRGICPGRRVMMLAHHNGMVIRADGHLDGARTTDDGHFLEIGPVHWELLERRRHIRVPISAEVKLRAVLDEADEAAVDEIFGLTMDISVSGAFVTAATLPEEGSLVEFAVTLNGEQVRILAVVAHITRERNGFGLHFVEYLDNARHQLHSFLNRAA